MKEHTYEKDSVEELLQWAKNQIEMDHYPKEKFQLDMCSTILDSKQYLESMIAMISLNWENPTFHPIIDQLWKFREKWEEQKV